MMRSFTLSTALLLACLLGACRPAQSADAQTQPARQEIANDTEQLSAPQQSEMKSDTQKTSETMTMKETAMMKKTMFGAGCFWGVQAAFDRIDGVIETEVGYSGGSLKDPTYRQVCGGDTGHTEVIEVTFDPEKVSYGTLVDTFWSIHDPTQFNRQGPDVGYQYRSVIFTYDQEQDEQAKASLERAQQSEPFRGREIVTRIEPAQKFYPAEEYHQKYLAKRGMDNCH